MKNKLSEAGRLALTLSLSITGILIALFLFISWIDNIVIPYWHYLLLALVIFLFSYKLIQFVINKFIAEKIQIIYKTIRSSKSPKGVASTTRDNSLEKVNLEVVQWTEAKKQEIEELKKMALYRREFLGNVSHELKTPIFNVQGYILTLLDGGLEDPTVNVKFLKQAEKSINRLIALVDDLEKISQLESGNLKLNYSAFDVIALSKEVIELLEIKSKNKNINIGFSQPVDVQFTVNADRERVKEVLLNLIDNAIKYSPLGGRVSLAFFDMDKNHILIEITDNGHGIEAGELPRIFERFYRIDKGRSREEGGTGLGLAIVKHIIEAHDETINVRSTPGIGTTFAFTLTKV